MPIPSLNVLKIEPIPSLSDEINRVRQATAEIVTGYVIPEEGVLYGLEGEGPQLKLRLEIEDLVRRAGLWAPHLPKEYGGMGIGFMAHAYMNEIMAWSMASKRCFGVNAPNSGNQSVLVKYATDEQKKKWLEPLVRGACAWALGQLGCPEARRVLAEALEQETDDEVCAEIRASLPESM